MKTLLSLYLILVSSIGLYAQKWSPEEKAVIKVLKEEGDTFAKHNWDALSALHVRDETAVRMAGVENVIQGWDNIQSLLQGYIDRNRTNPVKNPVNLKENIVIKVTGNTAWLVCDNIWKWEEFEGEDLESLGFDNKQIAFFEKVDGKWKFSFNAFIAKPEIVKDEGI